MFKTLLAILGATLVLLSLGMPAEAAPTGLNASQSCTGSTAEVTFTWRGVSATSRQVWIDLTTADNWRTGTYISAGPFGAGDTTYTWPGIKPNEQHFYRITEQVASGQWIASVTSSFTAVCGSAAATGATAEEQSYRNRATAQLYALVVRLAQSRGSGAGGRGAVISVLNDFSAQMNGLAPVPPRFRDVHDQLQGSLYEVVALLQESGTLNLRRFEALLDELADALEDYQLVVGITLPSTR